MRIASCDAPISIEKTATGKPPCKATCSATSLQAPFSHIQEPCRQHHQVTGLQSDVIRSRSANPVDTPVMSFGLLAIPNPVQELHDKGAH